jgi:hypothetical protein
MISFYSLPQSYSPPYGLLQALIFSSLHQSLNEKSHETSARTKKIKNKNVGTRFIKGNLFVMVILR